MNYRIITALLLSSFAMAHGVEAQPEAQPSWDDPAYLQNVLESIDRSLSEIGTLELPAHTLNNPNLAPSVFSTDNTEDIVDAMASESELEMADDVPLEDLEVELTESEVPDAAEDGADLVETSSEMGAYMELPEGAGEGPSEATEAIDEDADIVFSEEAAEAGIVAGMLPAAGLRRQTWPLVAVESPVHLGDTVIRKMQIPEPYGEQLEVMLNLEPGVAGSSLILTMAVSDMVPRKDKRFKEGAYQNKLLFNGNTIDVLNRNISGKESSDIKTISLPIDSSFVQGGQNQLIVQAGDYSGNHDDFIVHNITIDLDRSKR